MGKKIRIHRQGDVLLKEVRTKPKGKWEKHRQYTVAEGEATGHHHTAYPLEKSCSIQVLTQEDGRRYIDFTGQFALRHQEHDEQTVEAGCYEVCMEREYDPFEKAMKKVID